MTNPTPTPDTALRVALEQKTVGEETLLDLRCQIAELVGYHWADGAVPVEKLSALLTEAVEQ